MLFRSPDAIEQMSSSMIVEMAAPEQRNAATPKGGTLSILVLIGDMSIFVEMTAPEQRNAAIARASIDIYGVKQYFVM